MAASGGNVASRAATAEKAVERTPEKAQEKTSEKASDKIDAAKQPPAAA